MDFGLHGTLGPAAHLHAMVEPCGAHAMSFEMRMSVANLSVALLQKLCAATLTSVVILLETVFLLTGTTGVLARVHVMVLNTEPGQF